MTLMERSRDLVLSVKVVQFMCECAGQVSSSSVTSTWGEKKNKKLFFQSEINDDFFIDFRSKISFLC